MTSPTPCVLRPTSSRTAGMRATQLARLRPERKKIAKIAFRQATSSRAGAADVAATRVSSSAACLRLSCSHGVCGVSVVRHYCLVVEVVWSVARIDSTRIDSTVAARRVPARNSECSAISQETGGGGARIARVMMLPIEDDATCTARPRPCSAAVKSGVPRRAAPTVVEVDRDEAEARRAHRLQDLLAEQAGRDRLEAGRTGLQSRQVAVVVDAYALEAEAPQFGFGHRDPGGGLRRGVVGGARRRGVSNAGLGALGIRRVRGGGLGAASSPPSLGLGGARAGMLPSFPADSPRVHGNRLPFSFGERIASAHVRFGDQRRAPLEGPRSTTSPPRAASRRPPCPARSRVRDA